MDEIIWQDFKNKGAGILEKKVLQYSLGYSKKQCKISTLGKLSNVERTISSFLLQNLCHPSLKLPCKGPLETLLLLLVLYGYSHTHFTYFSILLQ